LFSLDVGATPLRRRSSIGRGHLRRPALPHCMNATLEIRFLAFLHFVSPLSGR
jgi:hypothetical protein